MSALFTKLYRPVGRYKISPSDAPCQPTFYPGPTGDRASHPLGGLQSRPGSPGGVGRRTHSRRDFNGWKRMPPALSVTSQAADRRLTPRHGSGCYAKPAATKATRESRCKPRSPPNPLRDAKRDGYTQMQAWLCEASRGAAEGQSPFLLRHVIATHPASPLRARRRAWRSSPLRTLCPSPSTPFGAPKRCRAPRAARRRAQCAKGGCPEEGKERRAPRQSPQ